MSDTTLNQEFDVVVIETTGDISITTCFKNYSDYVKDKVMVEGEPAEPLPYDLSGLIKLGGILNGKRD